MLKLKRKDLWRWVYLRRNPNVFGRVAFRRGKAVPRPCLSEQKTDIDNLPLAPVQELEDYGWSTEADVDPVPSYLPSFRPNSVGRVDFVFDESSRSHRLRNSLAPGRSLYTAQ